MSGRSKEQVTAVRMDAIEIMAFVKALGFDSWNDEEKKKARTAVSLLLICVHKISRNASYRAIERAIQHIESGTPLYGKDSS